MLAWTDKPFTDWFPPLCRLRTPAIAPLPQYPLKAPFWSDIPEKKPAGSKEISVCPSMGLLMFIPFQITAVCWAVLPRIPKEAIFPGPYAFTRELFCCISNWARLELRKVFRVTESIWVCEKWSLLFWIRYSLMVTSWSTSVSVFCCEKQVPNTSSANTTKLSFSFSILSF